MRRKMKAYTARKIVETFARDPHVSPHLREVLKDLLGADMQTFAHSRVNAKIQLTADGHQALEGGVDVDLVTVIDANGRRRILILA